MLLQLAIIGILIALLPLSYVMVRGSRDKYRKLVWITAFLTLDLIMFGSFTRLTDSGLGCPDWPGCYGHSNPHAAMEPIRAAETALPSGPVTLVKAWIEMIHRYFAMAVGVLIISLMVLAWVRRRELRQSPWFPTGVFLLVCVQGAFGMLTVTMKLQPIIVVTHLLLAMALLASLIWLGSRNDPPHVVAREAASLRGAGLLAIVLLVIQIFLGGWVSTNYAVLACTTFPTCQGSWWPAMDFAQGFQIWRKLGMLQDGSHISFAALTAIHYVHRLMAYVVLLALGLVAWRFHRSGVLPMQARWIGGLALLQLVTGLSNVVLDWPLVAAVLHTGGAAALVVVLTWALVSSRAAPAPQEFSAPTGASRVSA